MPEPFLGHAAFHSGHCLSGLPAHEPLAPLPSEKFLKVSYAQHRAEFAGRAMQGLLTSGRHTPDAVVSFAAEYADDLIAELERTHKP